MNRRKPELQAIDLATWPGIAWTDLDSEARKVIRQRMHALELFVQGEPVDAIEKSTGVNRRQLYRWLERCLSLHPDGCVFGFRALQPYSRVVPYARLTGVVVQGEWGSRGTAGAFSQLLESYPVLATWLRLQVKRRRVTIEQIHTDGRLHTRLHGLQPLHVAFLQECRVAGLTVAEYPFSTDGRAIRSLGAHLKAEVLRTFAAGARAAGASHLKGCRTMTTR
jgi:hypothetical protein